MKAFFMSLLGITIVEVSPRKEIVAVSVVALTVSGFSPVAITKSVPYFPMIRDSIPISPSTLTPVPIVYSAIEFTLTSSRTFQGVVLSMLEGWLTFGW